MAHLNFITMDPRATLDSIKISIIVLQVVSVDVGTYTYYYDLLGYDMLPQLLQSLRRQCTNFKPNIICVHLRFVLTKL